MRPQGCQETAASSLAAAGRRNLQISNPFPPPISLALLKSGTYTDHVKLRPLLFASAFGAALLASPATPRAQTVQRSLYVSALDDTGAPVAALTASDLTVREDKVSREVLQVGPADDPMQLAVLVDNSQAARNYIQDIRTGLEAFVTDMTNGTRHELAIVSLGERPQILAEQSADRARIMKGVYRIFELRGSGNYLLDGIVEVTKGFKKREARRPVIVAVTTEGPEYSSRQWEDVVRPLREGGVALHVIVLGRPSTAVDEEARNRSMLLDEGPRATGGRRETLLATSALTGALKKLAAELKQQYRVTYARPPTLIPPERVTVAATRPGLTVRGTLIPEKTEKK
jgi:hypothetical protein